ncbi:MAG: hypothetical protein Q8R91_06415 [Candidatus Omnitrophota bacterium]|nr:hypothetical protein [Candidatus Omnitrophota bacterium]
MEHPSLSEYQDALRELLLSMMQHPGACRLHPRGAGCRVLWALPQLVDIAATGQGDPSAAEKEAIRTQICSRCEYQDANGHCPLRMSGQCCLSREEGRVIAVIRRVSRLRHVPLEPAAPERSGDQ